MEAVGGGAIVVVGYWWCGGCRTGVTGVVGYGNVNVEDAEGRVTAMVGYQWCGGCRRESYSSGWVLVADCGRVLQGWLGIGNVEDAEGRVTSGVSQAWCSYFLSVWSLWMSFLRVCSHLLVMSGKMGKYSEIWLICAILALLWEETLEKKNRKKIEGKHVLSKVNFLSIFTFPL